MENFNGREKVIVRRVLKDLLRNRSDQEFADFIADYADTYGVRLDEPVEADPEIPGRQKRRSIGVRKVPKNA